MPILLQLGLIFGALIAPGLAAVYLARAIAPSPERESSAETTILTAMTIAITLISIEFVLLSVSSALDGGLRIWMGLTLAELVSDDPRAVVQSRPTQVMLVASLEYSVHLIILAVLGWSNPLRFVLRSRLAKQGLSDDHPFEDAIWGVSEQLGKSVVVWASAVLRDGRTYSGTLQSVSFRPLGDGSRELFMQSVERIGGGEREPVGAEGTPNGLVLNTRDVIALELAYAEVPSAAEDPAA